MNSKRAWRGDCSRRIAQVGKGENDFLWDFWRGEANKRNESQAPRTTEMRSYKGTPHPAATTHFPPAHPRPPRPPSRPLSGRGWGQRFPAFSQRMLLLPIGSTHARAAGGSGKAVGRSLPPSRAGSGGTRSAVLTEGWGEECSCPVLPGLGSAFSVSPCTSLLPELPRSRYLWRPSPRCDIQCYNG